MNYLTDEEPLFIESSDFESLPSEVPDSQPSTRSSSPRNPTLISQIESLPTEIEKRRMVSLLPRLYIGKRSFVLSEWLHQKRGRTSFIKKYGFYVNEIINNEKGAAFWVCRACDAGGKATAGMFKVTATSSSIAHLSVKHKITINNPAETTSSSSSSAASAALSQLQAYAQSRPSNEAITAFAVRDFRDAFVDWVVESNVPLNAVAHDTFQRVIMTPREVIQQAMPQHHQTVRNWVVEDFKKGQEGVSQALQSAKSVIHISFDGWTSPNQLSILAVVAHFIDCNNIQRSQLLGFKRIRGSHSGVNTAPIIRDVINAFNITRIGFFTVDNASSNDTCITHLLTDLVKMPSLKLISTSVPTVRLRCWGHIINLIAKAFLKLGASSPNTQQQPEESPNTKITAISKLHDVVTFIRRSPQRRDELTSFIRRAGPYVNPEAHAEELFEADEDVDADLHHNIQLINSNDTRWNSTFKMIKRALFLKTPLRSWTAANSVEGCDRQFAPEKVLTADDWGLLEETARLLGPLDEETARFEARSPAYLGWVLISFNRLYHHFQDFADTCTSRLSPEIEPEPRRPQRTIVRPRHLDDFEVAFSQRTALPTAAPTEPDENEPNSELLYHCCQRALGQLEHYQKLIDQTPVYWAATILHPGLKRHWVDRVYPTKAEHIRVRFEQLFKEGGWATDEAIIRPLAATPSPRKPGELPPLVPDSFYDSPDEYDDQATKELKLYYAERPHTAIKCPIKWWLNEAHRFPLLSRMAIDIMCAPSMSAECERTFSQAKLTVSSQRHSLNEETIEAIECLKSWRKTS